MWQFIAYCIVGGINTVVHFSILAALVELGGVRPAYASSVGFFAIVLIGFFLNRRFVFAQTQSSVFVAGTKFLVMTLIAGTLNAALMKVFTEHFDIHYLLAQMMVDATLALGTFTGAKHWVFRRKRRKDHPPEREEPKAGAGGEVIAYPRSGQDGEGDARRGGGTASGR